MGIGQFTLYNLVGGFTHCLLSIIYGSYWRNHIFHDGYCTTNQLYNRSFIESICISSIEKFVSPLFLFVCRWRQPSETTMLIDITPDVKHCNNKLPSLMWNEGLPAGKRLQSAMENQYFYWVNPLWMAIFNSYVSLPEGIFYVSIESLSTWESVAAPFPNGSIGVLLPDTLEVLNNSIFFRLTVKKIYICGHELLLGTRGMNYCKGLGEWIIANCLDTSFKWNHEFAKRYQADIPLFGKPWKGTVNTFIVCLQYI